jgi:hypothetical protein
MGTCMAIAEAAGIAAALAVRDGRTPKDVDVVELREELAAKGAVLPGARAPEPAGASAR